MLYSIINYILSDTSVRMLIAQIVNCLIGKFLQDTKILLIGCIFPQQNSACH